MRSMRHKVPAQFTLILGGYADHKLETGRQNKMGILATCVFGTASVFCATETKHGIAELADAAVIYSVLLAPVGNSSCLTSQDSVRVRVLVLLQSINSE